MEPVDPPSAASDASSRLPRRYDHLAPAFPAGGLDVRTLFPAGATIELEIGFGRGMFLRQRNLAAPEACLVGIEIKRKWAYRVARGFERRGIERVKVFAGDIRLALPNLGPDSSLARAFLHFPDPWWKKRHAKRRVMGEQILDELGRLLAPGGEFFVQTDVEERADEYAEQLRAHARFELGDDAAPRDNPYDARSNREQRAIDDGLPIYRVLARRTP